MFVERLIFDIVGYEVVYIVVVDFFVEVIVYVYGFIEECNSDKF